MTALALRTVGEVEQALAREQNDQLRQVEREAYPTVAALERERYKRRPPSTRLERS